MVWCRLLGFFFECPISMCDRYCPRNWPPTTSLFFPSCFSASLMFFLFTLAFGSRYECVGSSGLKSITMVCSSSPNSTTCVTFSTTAP